MSAQNVLSPPLPISPGPSAYTSAFCTMNDLHEQLSSFSGHRSTMHILRPIVSVFVETSAYTENLEPIKDGIFLSMLQQMLQVAYVSTEFQLSVGKGLDGDKDELKYLEDELEYLEDEFVDLDIIMPTIDTALFTILNKYQGFFELSPTFSRTLPARCDRCRNAVAALSTQHRSLIYTILHPDLSPDGNDGYTLTQRDQYPSLHRQFLSCASPLSGHGTWAWERRLHHQGSIADETAQNTVGFATLVSLMIVADVLYVLAAAIWSIFRS